MPRIEIATDRAGNARSRAVYFNPPGRYVTPDEPLVTHDEKVLARARRMSLVRVVEDDETEDLTPEESAFPSRLLGDGPEPADKPKTKRNRPTPPAEGTPGEPGT